MSMPFKKLLPAFILLLLLAACGASAVNKKDFFTEPKAVRNGDFVEINFGTTAAADWIAPPIKIEGEIIYVKGSFAVEGVSMTISIRVPDPDKRYRVIWIDKDGTKNEIPVN